MVVFKVLDEGIYAIEDRLTLAQSNAKAQELRKKAFGMVSSILFGAKPEDIEVTYVELRYEPFWHIVCGTHIEYNRAKTYKIEVDDTVKSVTVDGVSHDTDGTLVLEGMEHCVEELRKEEYIDASTGKQEGFGRYAGMPSRKIDETEELMEGETIVVPAKVKASYLTRKILSEMIKPVKADEVITEEITVEKLHLYFRPVYVFEYLWRTKGKTASIELDGSTLEYKGGGKPLKQKMAEFIAEDDLFDIGTGVVDLLVPGGGVALKIAKKINKKRR